MWQKLLTFLPRFWSNWITLLGTALTTVAGSTIIFSLAASLVTQSLNTYAAAIAFMVMPGIFIVGLVIIAFGFLWERWRHKDRKDPIQEAFRLAFKDARSRRLIFFVSLATFVNIFLLGLVGSASLSYMDTPEFCGTLCHSVMEPEYITYKESPHSRVKCVQCHIGPGASWAVKSKIDGLRQVWGVFTGDFSRPVPSPVHALRPARDTCEQCHWPPKFHGNRVHFATHYDDDEENTPETTVLLMKIGGRDPETQAYKGTHWHISENIEVRYDALDEKREKVGRVQVFKNGELTDEYLPPEGAEGTVMETRAMDCIDCHNRPTHVFDQTPRLAVDRAFNEGLLKRDVPYLHEAATTVLKEAGDQVARDGAKDHFAAALDAFYKTNHEDSGISAEQLAQSAEVISGLYHRNIFPHLNLTWETHPNHLGHRGEEQDKRGCFRCHNDEHTTKDGKTISMDCELCHGMLAEEESPEDLDETLKALWQNTGKND
jgi:hypothetical protein